jgi:hypothetical protein
VWLKKKYVNGETRDEDKEVLKGLPHLTKEFDLSENLGEGLTGEYSSGK